MNWKNRVTMIARLMIYEHEEKTQEVKDFLGGRSILDVVEEEDDEQLELLHTLALAELQ